MAGNGLDEQTVMDAINRAKRRFFLRPRYIARHAGDLAKLATSKWGVAWQIGSRMLLGTKVVDAAK